MRDRNKYIYKKIDIIIPVYNGFEYLETLLMQVKERTDLDYELYVIDDKSPDERVFPLLKRFEKTFDGKMHLLQNEINLGFLKTVNRGLNLTTNDVCILNTDVQLPKNWATRLFYYIFTDDSVASVTPFSNAATMFSFPQMWIDNDLKVDFNIIDKCISDLPLDKLPLPEFPTGVGFCMAMSRIAIDKVGVLDEIFEKGYGEENDWCMRAVNNNLKNVLCPNLFVYHKHGGSFDKDERKIFCDRHLGIIDERYPDYARLICKSATNKNYLRIRKLARLRYIYCLLLNCKFSVLAGEFSLKRCCLWKNIFSIRNENIHKVITILGIKLKFKSEKLKIRASKKQVK